MTDASVVVQAAGVFAVASALFTVLPGPDTAVSLASAVDGGRRAAVRAAFGIATGHLTWALAASAGIAAVLQASAEVFTVFRILCVMYLLWMGLGALRHMIRRDPAVAPTATGRSHLPWGYRRAALAALFNPKLGIFFVVLLPQFVPAGTSGFAMTLIFGAIQAAVALSWYVLVGVIAAALRSFLGRGRVRRVLDGITGAVFTFFGARLALGG